MLRNIVQRVREEHRLELKLAPEVEARLRALCTADLTHGGRGIGNALESVFINPLARALFATELAGRSKITVTALAEHEKVFDVALRFQ